MTFKVKLIEGMHRGFLSNYLTILTSFRTLEKRGIDLEKVCVSPSMFMLYGNPNNWFDELKVSDDADRTFNTQDGWDCDYPWASFRDFDLDKYRKYIPYNERMQKKINDIPVEKYKNALGVHYRGTDGVGHTEFVDVKKYLKTTEEEFSSGGYDCIFLATDQTNIIDEFENYFSNIKVYYYDHQRTMSSAGLHYSIQAQPNSPERVLAGDEVLIVNVRGYLERFPQIRTKDIQPFIFNWRNQFKKTCATEDALRKIFDDVTVINSDEENTRPGWIDIGDDAYFGGQFNKALELFRSDKKVFFHVQGDATYDNWESLVNDAKKYYNLYEWGVYAPNVENVWYTPENTDINGIESEDQNIKMVACTDETVWFIHSDIIKEFYNRKLLQYMTPDKLKYGWGWDFVMNAISFLMTRPVIRDYNHTAKHPLGTFYSKNSASEEMSNLWNSLPKDIQECISYIKGDREKLIKYFE